MSKAEIGDLIVYSAQSRWSPMRFGIVYGFSSTGRPMVWTEKDYWEGGVRKCRVGKSEASGNCLIIRSKDGQLDERILAAVEWHINFDK